MTYLRSTLRGSLALFGVALGLIGTAGGAAADDAAPADDSAHIVVATEEEASVGTSAAQDEDAEIGDGLFIERPAPRPDAGNELRSDPTPAPAPTTAAPSAPAPAPVAPASTSGGAVSPAAQTTAAASAPATLIPARPTEVRGVQIERATTERSSAGSVPLARTGVDTEVLTVLAGVLLALGMVLIRTARPRRATI